MRKMQKQSKNWPGVQYPLNDVSPYSDGNQGLKGDRGQKGEQGARGAPGNPEPVRYAAIPLNTTESSGGTVYIRWGRDSCPESAQLVYHGKNDKLLSQTQYRNQMQETV